MFFETLIMFKNELLAFGFSLLKETLISELFCFLTDATRPKFFLWGLLAEIPDLIIHQNF